MITDEERKAFMTGFPDRKRNDLVSGRTDAIKGEDKEKFFVKKVIKMHFKKGEGRVSCEMGWIPSESGYLGTI